jgi:DNA-binding FrmR family transcriptional regulator
MSHTDRDRAKLRNRIKRIHGQIESVERTLSAESESDSEAHDCAQVLMLLAAVRGGINSLMAEVLEDHIRLHLLQDGHAPLTPELGEDLIDLVRAYLK